ncbi:MAG: hypothetical protein ACKOPQ_14330 [Novosphingobium sp.]
MRLLSLALCFLALFSRPALADSWPPPQAETTYSPNKLYRFVSTPRDIESRLAYFRAKAEGRDLPPAPPARGQLERLNGSQWQSVWTTALANEVAPVSVLVSDDGKWVVTFDNWHSMGHGDNVVVIYGAEGTRVRSLRLDELMPAYFIDALAHSVSSIHWRGDPVIEGGRLMIPVVGDVNRSETPAYHITLALEDGAVAPLSAEVLAKVKSRFCAGHIDVVKAHNAWLAFERSDLAPWGADPKLTWQRYEYQVRSRLRTGPVDDLDDLTGSFEVPLPGEYMGNLTLRSFRQALQASASEMPVRWLSSRDPARLTAEIERTARKIKPGQLAGVELHVMTTKEHWPRVSAALAASGAKVVLADIGASIPQRADNLAQAPAERAIDPACAGMGG